LLPELFELAVLAPFRLAHFRLELIEALANLTRLVELLGEFLRVGRGRSAQLVDDLLERFRDLVLCLTGRPRAVAHLLCALSHLLADLLFLECAGSLPRTRRFVILPLFVAEPLGVALQTVDAVGETILVGRQAAPGIGITSAVLLHPLRLGGDAALLLRDLLRLRLPDMAVPDFEAEPGKLAELPWAALSAGEFWAMNDINRYADVANFDACCDEVNRGRATLEPGDTNGFDHRLRLFIAGMRYLP